MLVPVGFIHILGSWELEDMACQAATKLRANESTV